VVTEINAKTSLISLDSVLEGRGRGVLVKPIPCPAASRLTVTVIYEVDHDNAVKRSKDDWVMGSVAAGTNQPSNRYQQIAGNVFARLPDQWRKFLGELTQSFKSKDDAVEALKVLSATDSPMERVMSEVARNTNLSKKPESSGVGGWIMLVQQ
jgi:hypothetical protein